MKLHKIERISSIIPFYSTIFIAIVTMVEIVRYKASSKRKLQAGGILLLTVVIVSAINAYIPSSVPTIITWLICAVFTTASNFLLIELQKIMRLEKENRVSEIIPNPTPKKAKIGLWITLGVVGTIAFISILLGLMLHAMFSGPYSKLEDTNGPENTALVQITRDVLLSDTENCIKTINSESNHGDQTNAKRYSEHDYDRTHRTSKICSGVQTIHATNIEEGILTLKITSELKKGNTEIIIVIDGKYYSSVPLNETYIVTLDDIAGKTVLVRMGSEAAEIDVTVERTISTEDGSKPLGGQGDGTVVPSGNAISGSAHD